MTAGQSFQEWLAASCSEQGVPLKVEDPSALTLAAAMVVAARERREEAGQRGAA